MLRDLWVIMLLLGFVCLITSLILFFAWHILDLIDELSGRKAKRQIQLMREINSSTSALGKFSTNEVYMGISNASSLSEELLNIEEGSSNVFISEETPLEVNKEFVSVENEGNSVEGINFTESKVGVDDEIVTADLENMEKTTFLDDAEVATSYIEEFDVRPKYTIKILEEFSSL